MENTAVLFNKTGDEYQLINHATAVREIRPRTLNKDTLSRDWAKKNFTIMGDVNSIGALSDGSKGSYDYQDNSIVFKIRINANGISDVVDQETAIGGTKIGPVTLTDTMPSGWKVKPFEAGKNGLTEARDFLIYKADGPGNNPETAENDEGQKLTATELIENPSANDDTGSVQVDFNKNSGKFTFKHLKGPHIILLKLTPKEEKLKNYFGGAIIDHTVTNAATFTYGSPFVKDKTASMTRDDAKTQFEAGVIKKQVEPLKGGDTGTELTGTIRWYINYQPNGANAAIEVNETYLEDEIPNGIDLRTDSKGKLQFTDENGNANFEIKELTPNVDGAFTEGEAITDPSKFITYDSKTRTLKMAFTTGAEGLDRKKNYKLSYLTDVTSNAGLITNTAKIINGPAGDKSASASTEVTKEDAYATMELSNKGYIAIHKVKKGEPATKVKGVEFTLFATKAYNTTKDETNPVRVGTTDADGQLVFAALPIGAYILEETKAAEGYIGTTAQYIVKVGGRNDVTIDGVKNDKDNPKVIENQAGTVVMGKGNLTIKKTLAGSAASKTKEFAFTLTIPYLAKETMGYVGGGDKAGGSLTFNGTGETTFTLKGGQSITLNNLMADKGYTVTEKDYSSKGYTVTSQGSRGKIAQGVVSDVEFINTKNSGGSSGGGDNPGGGSDDDGSGSGGTDNPNNGSGGNGGSGHNGSGGSGPQTGDITDTKSALTIMLLNLLGIAALVRRREN